MSSTPIAYAIVKDAQAALQAIAVTAGDFYDVDADAVKLDPEHEVESRVAPDGPRPFIVIEPGALAMAFMDARAGEVKTTLPLTVHWVHEIDPTDDDALLQTFFRGCADVERALTQDITRGGRAVDTRITVCELTPIGDSALVWAEIKVEISSWRTHGAPTESA